MFRVRTRQVIVLLVAIVAAVAVAACQGSGDTSNGGFDYVSDTGSVLVADGGFGSTLAIRITGPLTVGTQSGFSVTALTSTGAPLAFIRIVCDTEVGVAILEPSTGGMAIEATGPDGVMSGVLGGDAPGSYMMECRGPAGYNIVDRIRVNIGGEIPEGYESFASQGAAGGTLGAGGLPGTTTTDDIRIASITFTDAPDDEDSATIDGHRIPDCDITDTNSNDPEPFYFVDFDVEINNVLSQRITINSIVFGVGAAGSTSVMPVTVPIEAGTTGNVTGLFIDRTTGIYAGGTTPVAFGTYPVSVLITGTTEAGESFSLTALTTISIVTIDRCGG